MNAIISPMLEHLYELLAKVGNDPEWKGYLRRHTIFVHGPERLEKMQIAASDRKKGKAFDPLQAAVMHRFVRQGMRPSDKVDNAAAARLLDLTREKYTILIACTCPSDKLDEPQTEIRERILELLHIQEIA